MLTSFFGKSNPINYLILAILILGGCSVFIFKLEKNEFTWSSSLENIGFAILTVQLFSSCASNDIFITAHFSGYAFSFSSIAKNSKFSIGEAY